MQIDAFLAQDGVFRSVEDLFRCRLWEDGEEDGEEEEEEEDGAAEEGKGEIKGGIKGKRRGGTGTHSSTLHASPDVGDRPSYRLTDTRQRDSVPPHIL